MNIEVTEQEVCALLESVEYMNDFEPSLRGNRSWQIAGKKILCDLRKKLRDILKIGQNGEG